MIRRAQAFLLSLCLAALAVGSGHANTYTYTRSNAGETTGLLPGMSIDQSNFAGGTFGTTNSTYPAVNFDNYKAGTEGVQLNFSIPTGSYRIDIPQGVNACYGIKWAAPSGEVFTSVNLTLFNSCNEFPFKGSAYAVSGGIPTLLGSWGNGGVTPATGGSFSFATEQNVTEIRVYALDARLGTTGNNQPYPNVFRAWNGQTLGISSIQVATAAAPLPGTFTYTRGGAGETTGFLPGMSIDQSNFAGGTFGTTNSTYPAVNFDNYKAGTEGVQLKFSIPDGSYRLDIPQGVNACYGIKWAAPNGQVFTSVNFSLFNSTSEFPFKGSAYAVSGGVPTLLGSWGNGGVTPTNGGSFNFTTEQNVTEIRVYALDARLGTTGNDQQWPNIFRAWNGETLGINSIQVATALVPAMQCVAISPMVKLRRDQSAVTEANGVAGTHMISVAAARGEGQSAQVLVSALRNFSNGSVSYTPLTGPGGATITPEWRLADYVHVTRPTWVSYKVAGYYPDPLVALKPFSLRAGDSQSVWMDVWVPRTAAPGNYTGTVTIRGGGMETTLPVSLTVKNVLLPVTARLDTLVQFLYSRQRLTPAAYNALCEMGLKYRFTSAPNLQWDAVFSKNAQGAWQADWTALDAEVERFLPLGITQFKIECVPWALKAPTGAEAAEWNAKLSLTSQHLRAKGWMDKFLFYIFDEPTTVEVINDLNGLCDFIHAIDPDFRILYTNGSNLWGLNADVYVTHNHLWENQGVANMEQKRQAGCEVWAYTCMGTQNIGHPDTWKIDWRGTGARALGWWLWMRQADGYLYWCLDAWSQDPYNITDPITGVNGDGFMFYPDSQNNPSIPSLRLSLMRDALQDYDLLAMLKDKIGTNAALMAQYGSLLTTTNAFSYSGQYSENMEYQDNPAMYEQRHTDLLNALDALSRNLGANSAVPGTAYSSSIAGSSTNAYAAPLTYERLSGPAWLNIASNGALTGTPQSSDGGVNVWTVRVRDEFGGSTIARLSIEVLAYPTNNYGTLQGNSTTSFFNPGYINRIQLADLDKTSGNNDGYADFRSLIATLTPGESVNYTFTPGGNSSSTVRWTVWIDFNRDGDFGDAGEMTVDPTAGSSTAVSGSFTVPSVASVGPSRMRIAMRRSSNGQSSPTGSFSNGEVEDYSVQIGTSPIPNAAPYFLSDPIAKAGVTAGSPMSASLAADAADWEGDALTYVKTSGPAWLTVASNGAVSGTPPTSAHGANNFVVSVTDGSGGTDSTTLQINVVAAPYELWKQEKFTPAQLAQPGVAGELDDPDRDGTPNLLEYALGMNQNVASSSGLPVSGILGGYLTLSFNRQKAATDITYQVEAVGNLNSSWVEIWNSFNLPYGGGENPSDLVTVQDTVPVSDAPKRFMRLKVTK
jgi:hypothetical protein